MEHKLEFLNLLPQDLAPEIVPRLPTPAILSLASTSKAHQAFFAPVLLHRQAVQQFLRHVVHGDHAAVTAMLRENITLLVHRDQVTDYSQRTFDLVSGFEYAVWALDAPMWTTMLACIPKNEWGTKLVAQLQAQYHRVKTQGITYTLQGKIHLESHFDLQATLLAALQSLLTRIALMPRTSHNRQLINLDFRADVGGAQKLLPMHFVAEYCSQQPFDPLPTFDAQPKFTHQFFNWETDDFAPWYQPDSRLGIDFALVKGASSQAESYSSLNSLELLLPSLRADLNAFSALDAQRRREALGLISELNAWTEEADPRATP
ncbi:MAG: F-box protein [Legionella sp.]|nr:F-box protein [Legionella sp.]